MSPFILITEDGFAYQPDSVSTMPDVDNCQILGFTQGRTEEKAFKNFLDENEWLRKMTFRARRCYELENEAYESFLIPTR